MERILSPEERYKRAQELYMKRNNEKVSRTKSENNNFTKKSKIKKIFIQLSVSALIYFTIFSIKNGNFAFSNNIFEKAKYYISYDSNIQQIYNNGVNYINNNFISKLFDNNSVEVTSNLPEQAQEEQHTNQENNNHEESTNVENTNIQEVPSQELDTQQDNNAIEVQNSDTQNENVDNVENESQELGQGGAEDVQEQETASSDQMVNDANDIKQRYQFQKPLEGTVSSRFGYRNSTSPNVPKNHTGIDIAVPVGTEIKSAISGTVSLVSSVGDYGKHVKIAIDDITVLYAHCSEIKVKEGEIVEQGQVIALSGNTGNTTGPHLHFEIRKSGRLVNPEYVMSF